MTEICNKITKTTKTFNYNEGREYENNKEYIKY